MEKWRLLAVGLCLFLTSYCCIGCGDVQEEAGPESSNAIEVLPRPEDVNGKVAPIVGETISPDGKWKVQQVGAHAGVTADGTYAPDGVQIIDAVSREVMWEGIADHRQSVLWSPDSEYLAMSRTARGYGYITVIETAGWNEWDLTPPEGSNIPKHTFLPDMDWGEWISGNQIRLTIGRDGNAAPQTSYRCLLECDETELTATVLEQATEILSEEYDFDHDGTSEVIELVTIFDSTGTGRASWYELCVRNRDHDLLWKTEAGTSHVSWNSIFALTIDEKDYLLRYMPYIGMGFGNYHYWVFSLDGTGEVVYEEQIAEFDLYFHNDYQGFDPVSIASFLRDVHGYLNDSTLLLSTENGNFRSGGSGAEFVDDVTFWDENLPYNELLTLEENLQNYKDYMTELQRADAKADESA